VKASVGGSEDRLWVVGVKKGGRVLNELKHCWATKNKGNEKSYNKAQTRISPFHMQHSNQPATLLCLLLLTTKNI